MKLDEYAALDGVALAALVRSKQVSPQELADTALKAIAAVNPALNAVIGLTPRETAAAIERDSARDGVFAGVPFLIKDLGASIEGELQECGSRLAKGRVAEYDGELTKRYKSAGVVTIGRTNVPEFGDMATTEPLLYGPTHNPWALDKSSGGSSGGAAAAVAAGVVPIAHASDSGGSIRVPASWCGLVGLKPSRGRVAVGPDESYFVDFPVVEHVVTRTVRDCASMLDATCGPEDVDFIALPRPAVPFAEECKRDPGKLRIAFVASLSSSVKATPDRMKVFETTLHQLGAAGHELEAVASPVDLDAPGVTELLFGMWGTSGTYGQLQAWAEKMGRPLSLDTLELGFVYGWGPSAVDPSEVSVAEQLAPSTHSYHDYQTMRAGFMKLLTSVNAFFRRYDVLVTLTNATDPPNIGDWRYNGTLDERIALYDKLKAASPGVFQWSLMGHPAMTLPLGMSSAGLPVGVQIISALSNEAVLYRLAAQLEKLMPWHARRPSMHVGNAQPK